jgi:hypothetical protein
MSTNTQPAPAPQSETGSVEAAAAAFERLLSGKPEKQTRTEAPVEADEGEIALDTAPEVDEAEVEDGKSPDEGEDRPAETDETEDGEQPEGEPDEGVDPTQKFTVKIDGKNVEVTIDELKNGYSRTQDYHRKTEALAQERRVVMSEVQAVQQERGIYAQILPALIQQVQSSMPAPPDPNLRVTDPLEYVLQKDAYDEGMRRIQAAQAEMQRLEEAQHEQSARELSTVVRAGLQKLPELIPQWKDPKVYEQDRKSLREYGRKIGYTDAEMDQAYDPRAVAALYKAMKYDALAAKKLTPTAPVERTVRQPIAPAAQPRRNDLSKAKDRLAKSGRVEDAAAAFRALL